MARNTFLQQPGEHLRKPSGIPHNCFHSLKMFKRLHVYLDEQEKMYHRLLSTQPSSQHWSKLGQVTTLTQVMLFNRRREGEVSQMPLSTYISSNKSDAHPDISMALTELENKLCQYFKRVEIRGKRGKKGSRACHSFNA